MFVTRKLLARIEALEWDLNQSCNKPQRLHERIFTLECALKAICDHLEINLENRDKWIAVKRKKSK